MSATTGAPDGAIVVPEPQQTVAAATRAQLEGALADLDAAKDRWVTVGVRDRIALLDRMIDLAVEVSDDWAELAARHKGISPGTTAYGEDLSTGPLMLVRQLRLLRDSLRDLDRYGRIRLPAEPTTRPDGQVVVPVFPTGWRDRATFVGMSGEVWLEPHVGIGDVRTATPYHEPGPGRVCFVLGAGNISSIGASDALHKLFQENQVCVLKMNPVNEHVGPLVERALRPLVDGGFLRIVYGGADVGSALAHHDTVDTLHMTGSDKTHDAIVFGVGEEGRRRKEADEPVLDKPFTTELGNVTPIIVVPGPWKQDDLDYQGKHIVSMVAQNAGFNCGCPRMVVTHRRWRKRRDLLGSIRRSLREVPQRDAYYPGARDRWQLFVDAHPDAEIYGPVADGHVPWTFLPDLDPRDDADPAFRVEAFNGVFGEVALDAPTDVGAYLDQAVDWCNDTLWGTLTATILVHPRSLKDPEVARAVDRAVGRLRYGAVGVNVWGAVSYGMISTTWGAFPGHARNDIQSGRGVVHNTFMLEDPQRSVVRSAWRLGKKPPMSYDFTTMPSLARRLIRFEAYGDVTQLPGVLYDGIRA